ncbi:Ppx/GppA family phosphatase [Swaminathania salitolerans]|uniref:Exopolyphosphatase n=1 Tax=Swaminathania salitolerans TaxID=182838 RepID=A0A511BMR6_9PROT|nr:Ppx/GppA family phosphatase [Swaminathania salitolerans]GBQ16001.1 exopolyphosphatase [Swaminathania salitolerans LMG 21291]GEL01565.1 exopolyphosphatase [Swaminathania salitolerans]
MTRSDAPQGHHRAAIVDLGSNSVRLVVFEGVTRNPIPIFNEKATLRLGRGLEQTGRLNEEGLLLAQDVMSRFNTIARAMDAHPFEVLATAAVRDASNGREFVETLNACMPDVPIRILSGEEEADYAATGVLCGLPDADGVVADIGGGSLELIRVADGRHHAACTRPLGVIRLSDRAGGDLKRARELVEGDLDDVAWLPALKGKPLYLVGGAFRALARLQIARTHYPLNIVHLYTLGADEAREMVTWLIDTPRKTLEKIPGFPRKRLDDVPYAATVLRRLMRIVQPSQIVFSVDGVREGWYMRKVGLDVASQDPCRALADEAAARLGRSLDLPEDLIRWTAPLFPHETPSETDLRDMTCRMSDIGSFDHPEYRAAQTYLRVMRMHGVGFTHRARAFVALALAVRYEADPADALMETSRRLLLPDECERAVQLGFALRLAYTICGGTSALLKDTTLSIEDGILGLSQEGPGTFTTTGSVRRRLERLAQSLSLAAEPAS